MDPAYLLGYSLAILVGFSLGLIGGGGSILTVPIMVYVVGINPILATGYSLFVVGLTSLFGAGSYIKRGLLNYRAAFVFAIPSLATIFLIRKYIMPTLPETLFTIGAFDIDRDLIIMVFFAVVMLVSSIKMIRTQKSPQRKTEDTYYNYPKILLAGLFTGAVTGPIGAGGGFLIVPALVLVVGLPMKFAVGTSLLVITINSLLGFLGDCGRQAIEWNFLLSFSFFAILGILLGGYTSRFVDGQQLKKAFGWFVLSMGVYIFIREVFIN